MNCCDVCRSHINKTNQSSKSFMHCVDVSSLKKKTCSNCVFRQKNKKYCNLKKLVQRMIDENTILWWFILICIDLNKWKHCNDICIVWQKQKQSNAKKFRNCWKYVQLNFFVMLFVQCENWFVLIKNKKRKHDSDNKSSIEVTSKKLKKQNKRNKILNNRNLKRKNIKKNQIIREMKNHDERAKMLKHIDKDFFQMTKTAAMLKNDFKTLAKLKNDDAIVEQSDEWSNWTEWNKTKRQKAKSDKWYLARNQQLLIAILFSFCNMWCINVVRLNFRISKSETRNFNFVLFWLLGCRTRVIDAIPFREADRRTHLCTHLRLFAPHHWSLISSLPQLQIDSGPCLSLLSLRSSAKRQLSTRPAPLQNERPHQKLHDVSQHQHEHELQYSRSAPRTMNWPRLHPPNLPSELP